MIDTAAFRWVTVPSVVVLLLAGCASDDRAGSGPTAAWDPPPPGALFDYQIGGDYDVPAGTVVVARDWFEGRPLESGYSICYVNAFQTQPDDPDVDRPDERSNWPPGVVLSGFDDDPEWDGEYLIDLGTAESRAEAAGHVDQMVEECAAKGFDAVEFDNLSSWGTLDGLPFDRDAAVAFAALLTDRAHALGLAVGQKNTPELGESTSLETIGFDFAVVEQCGEFDECGLYTEVFGDRLVVIEYSRDGFDAACTEIGESVSVVLRDVDVSRPDSDAYVYDAC